MHVKFVFLTGVCANTGLAVIMQIGQYLMVNHSVHILLCLKSDLVIFLSNMQ